MLTQAALDAIETEAPQTAARVYRNIARHLSERLRSATAMGPGARR